MKEQKETFDSYLDSLDLNMKIIISQYRTIAGAYDRFWQEVYMRTEKKDWEVDGAGSCMIPSSFAEGGLIGPARLHILKLRELRGGENRTKEEQVAACGYHCPAKGCVLGDLKSPECLIPVDAILREEIAVKFGPVLTALMPVRYLMSAVLLGNPGVRNGKLVYDPMANDILVRIGVSGIEKIISEIESSSAN